MDLGVEISAGELDNLLIVDKEVFHEEKAAIFEAGNAHSDYLNTDDTVARHRWKKWGLHTHRQSIFLLFSKHFFKESDKFFRDFKGSSYRLYSIRRCIAVCV